MAQLSDDCFAFGGPMMSVDEAVGLIAARVTPIVDVETVTPARADGRILAARCNAEERLIAGGRVIAKAGGDAIHQSVLSQEALDQRPGVVNAAAIGV